MFGLNNILSYVESLQVVFVVLGNDSNNEEQSLIEPTESVDNDSSRIRPYASSWLRRTRKRTVWILQIDKIDKKNE